MTDRTYYRAAVAIVSFVAVLTVPVLILGSTLTRVLFAIAVIAAGSLIYSYGKTN